MSGVSNSFDYTPVRELEGFRLDPRDCSARTLGLHRARTSRAVLVERARRVFVCATRTQDFTDAEIREVVHGLGQLYLDVSGKPQIDDFASDVRQLVITPECRACADLETCVVCYRESVVSFFAQDEAWLRDHLRGLSGRALDVGVGRGPYLDALAQRLESGAVTLDALDPEPCADLARWPIRLIEGGIETFRAEGRGIYDHVLAIRSLHHVEDLERAMRVICDVLRPFGRALFIESVALPLVRSRRHSDASHAQATGGFQHLRNWDSTRMLAFLDGRFPLRPVFHRPVGRATCDQWILVLERAAG